MKPVPQIVPLVVVLFGGIWPARADLPATNPVATHSPYRFRSAEDGWLDVAFGRDNTAAYVQVGSAWVRP